MILNIPCSTQEHLCYVASWGAATISILSFDSLDYHIKIFSMITQGVATNQYSDVPNNRVVPNKCAVT